MTTYTDCAYSPIADIEWEYPIQRPSTPVQKSDEECLLDSAISEMDATEKFGSCHRCGADILRKPRRYDSQLANGLCGRCASHAYFGLLAENVYSLPEECLLPPSNSQKRPFDAVFRDAPLPLVQDSTSAHPLQSAKSVYNVKLKYAGNHYIARTFDYPLLITVKIISQSILNNRFIFHLIC